MFRLLRPVTLYNYVTWEYLRTFLLTLFVCLTMIVMAMLVAQSADLEEIGVSYEQMLPLAPYFLPAAAMFAIPAASMIAAVLFFGRMAAENEIQAAQSGGASLALIAMPVIFCAVIFSVISLWCSDVGLAWGFTTLRDEVANITKPKVLARIDRPGNSFGWQMDSGGNVRIDLLPITEEEEASGKRPIHFAYFNQGAMQQSLFARNFHYTLEPEQKEPTYIGPKLLITLQDGQSFGMEDDKQVTVKRFDELVFEVPMPTLSEETIRWGRSSGTVSLWENRKRAIQLRKSEEERLQGLNERALDMGANAIFGAPASPITPMLVTTYWAETQRALDMHEAADAKICKLMVEFHRKLAIAMLPFFTVILGLGMGLLVRKSDRLLGFLLVLLFFSIVCYPLMTITKELASSGLLPAESLWMANLVTLLIGLLLWWAYEHGRIAGGTQKREAKSSSSWVGRVLGLFSNFLAPLISRIVESWISPFRRRCDRHVITLFLSPFVGLCVAVGGFCLVLDLAEHGGEVVEGVRKASEPLGGLPARSFARAATDVAVYYGIRSTEMVFYLIPIVLLISALLVVYNMIRDNEHLIFKSSGTRLQRAFMPLVFATLLLSLCVSALRELVMPGLILERDRLKPLVYHRSPRPKSISGTARDAEGQTYIFEVARYTTSNHLCEGVRFYFPSRMVGGRLVRLEADAMVWNESEREWVLKTAVKEGGEKALDSQGHEVRYANYGVMHLPEPIAGDPLDDPARFALRTVNRWGGQLTPSFIEGQEVGPSVVRAGELWAARYRPDFLTELWRRSCVWMTGLVLVLICVPLVLGREGRGRGLGIGLSILLGATYVVLATVVPDITRSGLPEPYSYVQIPTWSPLLPHVLFLAIGLWNYFKHMET